MLMLLCNLLLWSTQLLARLAVMFLLYLLLSLVNTLYIDWGLLEFADCHMYFCVYTILYILIMKNSAPQRGSVGAKPLPSKCDSALERNLPDTTQE
ncbi:hypothetical protein H671_5g13995 [Cricetulus griseus]|nr:hypothetical protein H671_5g13995 [Cricetulus griseus]